MKGKLETQIRKINALDKEILSVTLIKSIELLWSLDNIIDKNVSDYIHANKVWEPEKSECCKNCLYDLGNIMSNEFLNRDSGDFFMKTLLQYLEFEQNDEFAANYITEYCMNDSNSKDISSLKSELVCWVIESEELERNGI
ncbi:hypothetical protein [Metabacillus dongyingensis]|uniref:hypothetical protein n=1 Tax=Metabacillus dongyingensis TaxID=2874282 RepID=UPI001CBABADC|nr:hypothetical protein [Metabacillus dongyingensis]UAL53514.1 hypothetical protein K8L98_06935 [Metabacillus dongyingensis]